MVIGFTFASFAAPLPGFASEATPIPRDVRPNFAAFSYMLGTWNCSVSSSRRARAFPAKVVTQLSKDGYWLVTVTTTPPVPWNPIQVVASDYVTYDNTRNVWVDMTWDNYGLYGVSVSRQQTPDRVVWDDELYPKSHATAKHFPRTVRRIDDRTMESTQRFAEPSGRSFSVDTVCKK
jgi:hypothetical protein